MYIKKTGSGTESRRIFWPGGQTSSGADGIPGPQGLLDSDSGYGRDLYWGGRGGVYYGGCHHGRHRNGKSD